jgi:ribosomal protein L37AE/L43A
MAAGGRQFGGQLTAEHDASPEAASPSLAGLHADAPAFQPGQPIASRKQRAPREKKPQLPKSSAPDIATRTHEDIDNGHYECAICTEDVKRHSRGVWSCRTCWTVFHLGCIKRWSTNEGSAAARQQAQDGELPPPRQWRCPGCNLPKDVLPKNFHCWCEKELDPRALPGLPPFSCGQTCARPRVLPKSCPHPLSGDLSRRPLSTLQPAGTDQALLLRQEVSDKTLRRHGLRARLGVRRALRRAPGVWRASLPTAMPRRAVWRVRSTRSCTMLLRPDPEEHLVPR